MTEELVQDGVTKINCPVCKSNDCYEEKMTEEMDAYMCKDCGYVSNSIFTKDSDPLKQAMATMPEMIKDLKFFDEKRNIYWFLAVVQTPTAHAFPESDEDSWHWTVAPVVEFTEAEAAEYMIDEELDTYYSHRLALEKAKKFNKNDFQSVLKEVGLSGGE